MPTPPPACITQHISESAPSRVAQFLLACSPCATPGDAALGQIGCPRKQHRQPRVASSTQFFGRRDLRIERAAHREPKRAMRLVQEFLQRPAMATPALSACHCHIQLANRQRRFLSHEQIVAEKVHDGCSSQASALSACLPRIGVQVQHLAVPQHFKTASR